MSEKYFLYKRSLAGKLITEVNGGTNEDILVWVLGRPEIKERLRLGTPNKGETIIFEKGMEQAAYDWLEYEGECLILDPPKPKGNKK